MDETTVNLVARWRQGDQEAASVLFGRYAQQLIGLAAARLSARLAQRVDPKEVVQSAFRSFFVAARDRSFDLTRGGDLWRLLVSITLHKLHDQVKRNTAGKRSINREQGDALDLPDGTLGTIAAHGPSPLEAVALSDELEQLLRSLPALHRQVLELRLQGNHLDEIAAALRRSVRTVSRILDSVKQDLEQRASVSRACEAPGLHCRGQ
jgi:RNA polymerase sigma factor (sigma-70 family)